MSSSFSNILVTGATGFLGRHVVAALNEHTSAKVTGVNRSDFDLLKDDELQDMLTSIKPDAVIHLAAKVGGIIANRDYPADFYYENIMINTRMFDACFRHDIPKFLTFMGGCSYPATATSPIGEDQMWQGYPQIESAPYSTAKKMMLVQSASYRKQYDYNSVVLIPGNVYGEYDNFNEEYSHVIPAMIRRYIEAREAGKPSIYCYGSGRPTRDFVYAPDVAKLIPWFLENYNSSEPVNLSSGTRTAIKDLAETIKELTGYKGTLDWDTSQPDGQMDKIFATDRMKGLGLSCDTSLHDGLSATIKWFEEARKTGDVRL